MNTNILISIFASGTDSESRLVGLADVAGMMRGTCQLPPIVTAKLHGGDSLATLTARYRAALAEALDSNGGDADKAKHDSRVMRLKRRTPFVSIAAIYNGTGKSGSDITGMTQVCLADFDGLTPQQVDEAVAKAAGDPHTLCAHRSLSGRGLHILALYALPESLGMEGFRAAYPQVWQTVNAHYEQLLGLPGDKSVKDPTRGSFLAHDPQLFLNAAATPFELGADELRGARTQGNKARTRGGRGGTVGSASTSSSPGRPARPLQLDQLYEQRLRPLLERGGDTFATGQRHHYMSRLAHQLNEFGVGVREATAWAVGRFQEDGFDEREIGRIIADIYRANPHEHATRNAGERARTATVDEIKQWLSRHAALRHNTITARLEWKPGPTPLEGGEPTPGPSPREGGLRGDTLALGGEGWVPFTDRDLNTLWARMAAVQSVNIKHLAQVANSDYAPDFNPLTAYLQRLEKMQGVRVEVLRGASGQTGAACPSAMPGNTGGSSPVVLIDGRDPIAELAATVRVRGGDEATRFWHHCLRKWLVGMVAAWLDDSVVNELFLVLLGAQGTYKTTWFSLLMPPELRPYYRTKVDAVRLSKDDRLSLCEAGLICCEELDTLSPAEQNQLKAAVSMRYVDERAAYARFKEHRPHVASFCGTGNNTQLLTDRTGNRRWLPFEVESIQPPQHTDYHHDLVFLQAVTLYRHGFKYWLDAGDHALQAGHNSRFEAPSLEQELLDKHYRQPSPSETGEFVTVAEALQTIGFGIVQKLNPVLVGKAFSTLGFRAKRNSHSRGYIAVRRTEDEIKERRSLMVHEAEAEDESPAGV